jgi:hypothetical protein
MDLGKINQNIILKKKLWSKKKYVKTDNRAKGIVNYNERKLIKNM